MFSSPGRRALRHSNAATRSHFPCGICRAEARALLFPEPSSRCPHRTSEAELSPDTTCLPAQVVDTNEFGPVLGCPGRAGSRPTPEPGMAAGSEDGQGVCRSSASPGIAQPAPRACCVVSGGGKPLLPSAQMEEPPAPTVPPSCRWQEQMGRSIGHRGGAWPGTGGSFHWAGIPLPGRMGGSLVGCRGSTPQHSAHYKPPLFSFQE